MKKIEFLVAKGCVPAGYVGDYPEAAANRLIKKKIAKVFTGVKISKSTKTKED